ncbi:MAG TPA: tetratricopeptide repeat protein [Terriglobia bacterium]|nr:tetratricopeptide repeat protein [Terriglobia bacterium]
MKRIAKAKTELRKGTSGGNCNTVVASPDSHCEGPSTRAWIGRIACLLIALVVVTLSVSAQKKAPSQNDDTAAFTPRSQGSLVQTGSEDDLQKLKPLEDNIETGRYQETVAGLKGYLQDHPGSARAHYDLGYVFFRTHEIGGAVSELSKSLQLNVKDAQAHKILGLVCTFLGRYDLAEVELRSAAELEPNSDEIHYFLGRIYYTRQVFPLAEKEFKTAIQLNPSYMKAYANLGLVTEVLGDNAEAVKDYTTAAQMDEARHLHSPWPYEYLSAHYNRQQETSRAIEFANKALVEDPKCDLAYYDLAKAYQTQNNWQKSTDAALKAIAINSSTPEYYYLLSVALRKLGKIPESEEALKRFEEIHKNQNATAILWRNASHQQDLPESSKVPENEPH